MFEASNDQDAKVEGLKRLTEQNFTEHTYRLVSAKANLLLFQ